MKIKTLVISIPKIKEILHAEKHGNESREEGDESREELSLLNKTKQ